MTIIPGRPAVVGVVGAGTMGTGIAQVAALAGHRVLLFDAVPGAAQRGAAAVAERVERLAARGRLSRPPEALELSVVDRIEDLAPAGLIVEAVLEDLQVKRQLFCDLEAVVPLDCILATNTSSLSPTALAATLTRPQRLLGLHFFNPVPAMRLVEVVPGLGTAEAVTEAAMKTVTGWGKTAVRSMATPGFIVNRVARPFYAEAWRLLQERAASPRTVDAVLTRGAGFRMGPFELMDLIGHDVNAAVTHQVWAAFGHDPRFEPSLAQQALVDAGWLGRKAGRGVYAYAGDDPEPSPVPLPPCPPPDHLIDHGDTGLRSLAERAGVALTDAGHPEHRMAELPSGARLTVSDGRTATALAQRVGAPVIVVDRQSPDAAVTCMAISDGCPRAAHSEAAGLLQAAGLEVHLIDDTPGLVVTRTVAMLVNTAVDTLAAGVASAGDIDTAMRLGTNYPLGPLAWGDLWGPATVVAVLEGLEESYGDSRYRPSPLLRRRALAGGRLIEERK